MPDNATLVAVPGSFGRRAAFSNRDYDWFVYGHPRVVRVWTGQWRAASTPCADLWAPCGAAQGRKRVIQRRFNVGALEAIPKRKASTL